MSKRLWDKSAPVDAELLDFTIGDDPELDSRLVAWDCIGSAAHARTLERAGILNAAERAALVGELAAIRNDAIAGRFEIPRDLEDCHTAIETRLTERLGTVGEKVHTGRSRNDQVAAAMRLYMRAEALAWHKQLDEFIDALLARIERDGQNPMPGYTHMQPAMPSSVGQWLAAHAEAAVEQQRAIGHLLEQLNSSPLGTGAGFGVDLPLDREYTAKLLGFSRVQRSPIDVQNSRGRMELYFVRVATDIGRLIERMASDLLVYTSRAYGFFSLPAALTTGSSIMPQKRNPDVVELLRGRSAALRSAAYELEAVTLRLPSNYHRDLQLTKGPTLRAAEEVQRLLRTATRVVREFQVHPEKLELAMLPELYATAAAYALVREGVPFREAYRRVASDLLDGSFDASDHKSRSAAPDLRGDLAALKVERLMLTAVHEEFERRNLDATAALQSNPIPICE